MAFPKVARLMITGGVNEYSPMTRNITAIAGCVISYWKYYVLYRHKRMNYHQKMKLCHIEEE